MGTRPGGRITPDAMNHTERSLCFSRGFPPGLKNIDPERPPEPPQDSSNRTPARASRQIRSSRSATLRVTLVGPSAPALTWDSAPASR